MLPGRLRPAAAAGPSLARYRHSLLCASVSSCCLLFHALPAFLRGPGSPPPRMSQAAAGLASHWAKPLDVAC